MDPGSLTPAAVSLVTPYLLDFGKDAAKEAASDGNTVAIGWPARLVLAVGVAQSVCANRRRSGDCSGQRIHGERLIA